MPSTSSSSAQPFGDLPVLRCSGQWLLAAGTGTAPADRALAMDLDSFAVAMAAADRAVAALNPPPRERQ